MANQRAWVGPRNAKSEKAPELEKDLPLIVEYQNTGREPALETIFDVDVFTATEEEDQGGQVARKVNEFVNQCKIKWTPLHATVVFPSSVGVGSAGYTMSRTVPAEMIDQDVVDGQKAIVVSGCFVYKTAIHHIRSVISLRQRRRSRLIGAYVRLATMPTSITGRPPGSAGEAA